FQAEDGIRDFHVTGVQTCALPIYVRLTAGHFHFIQAKLETDPEKLWSLNEMEVTGGEPDVIGMDKKTGMHLFVDCAPESPKGRRSEERRVGKECRSPWSAAAEEKI